MRTVRRNWLGVVAIVLSLVAVVLVLFALDTKTWQSSVRRDDLRFRALPDHVGLWSPKTILPGDPAGLVLGTDDTVAWRRALQSFWHTRIGANPQANVNLPQVRATAQQEFQSLMSSAKTAAERSGAANLLGVLVITTPVSAGSQTAQLQVLKQSIAYFQQAVALDPTNAAAKQNLELLLRVTRPGKGPIGQDSRAGFGFGRGHGATRIGNGY
jgi:hypothetical protein